MENKLFIKIWTIAILLFSIILFTDLPSNQNYYNANAALTWSKVQLRVNNWTITCTGWQWLLNMWQVNAWFGTAVVSWTYIAPTQTAGWSCTDLNGTTARTFTIRITWDLYDSASHTISSWAAAICLMAAPNLLQWTTATSLSTTIPTCTATTWMVIAQELMKRSTTAWEIYQYWIRPRIQVTIPASQAAGTYTWVLEISVP